jgi:hypothetical protein
VESNAEASGIANPELLYAQPLLISARLPIGGLS